MKKNFVFIILSLLVCFPVMTSAEKKTNYRSALVMAYSPANNVYEDENIKVEIWDARVWITNKTDKTIFLDLSQCFGVHNGSSYPLFSKPTDETKASKMKLSTSIDDFISIAPTTGDKKKETYITRLGGKIFGEYTTTETPSGDFSEYSERLITLINEMVNESLESDPKGKNCIGTAYRHLTEDESISNIGVNIAYAFNKRAEEWTPAAISTWVSDVYFAPYYIEMPQELGKKDKRGFGVKKTEAAKTHIKANHPPFDFPEDRSPIIVADWTGNYKKGTFELNPTYILNEDDDVSFAQTATLFESSNVKTYKQVVIFDKQDADWGKMKYVDDMDLSKFEMNNK